MVRMSRKACVIIVSQARWASLGREVTCKNLRTRGITQSSRRTEEGLRKQRGKTRTDPLYTPPMEILVFTHGCIRNKSRFVKDLWISGDPWSPIIQALVFWQLPSILRPSSHVFETFCNLLNTSQVIGSFYSRTTCKHMFGSCSDYMHLHSWSTCTSPFIKTQYSLHGVTWI